MNDKQSRPEQLTVDYVADSRSDDSRVVSAVQQFLSALQAGSAPDRKEFAANFPEIASQLEKCLEGLELVHQAASDLGPAPGAAALPVNAAPNQLGDYRLLREIGRGGMGVVYEAMQISLKRRVAVKVLPFAAAIDRTHVQRFRNEAQAAAQLHHSNIVPVYAVGDERGIHYYAMQFIDGQPLSQVIAQLKQPDAPPTEATDFSLGTNGRGSDEPTATHSVPPALPTNGPIAATDTAANSQTGSLTSGMSRNEFFRNAAELIRQAAEALDYAHQFGVVHRDIKPANLLIDAHGTLWIADFGLAHIQADVSLTRTGDVLGTLAYMSPEQASGNRPVLDHRTDIYSLGVTLFELLTLEPIFPQSDRHALLRRIIEEDPRPLRRVNPDIPVELEIIVGKAIAKDPQQRYATAGQFAEDLRRWINDEPILARPPTRTERMRKWSRRHRSLVRTAGAFVLLGFIGLLVSTILIAAEQSKTEMAYQAERDQRLAADQSFRQARQAVDAFVQLGEDELANNPAQRTLRRKFLETALDYYHDFVNQRRDDPNVQAELAASSARVEQMIDELAVLEGYAPLTFLSDVRVGKELGLTTSQGDEIARRMAQLARDRDRAKAGRNGGNQAARQHQLAAVLREQQKAIAALLTADQMTRLKQIAWQQQGPLAFENSEIVEALQLTDAQQSQIAEIIGETRPARGKGGRGPTPPERLGPPGQGRAGPPAERPGPPAERPGPPGERLGAAGERPGPPDELADLGPNRERRGPPPGDDDRFGFGPSDETAPSRPNGDRRRPPPGEDDPLGFGPAGPPGRRGAANRRGPPNRRRPEGRRGQPGDFERGEFDDRPEDMGPGEFDDRPGEVGGRRGEFGGRRGEFGGPRGEFGGPPGGDLGPPGRRRRFDDEPGGDEDFAERRPPRPGGAGRGAPGGRAQTLPGRQRAVARILALLSDEQQRIWEELIGEPFEVDLQMRPEDWQAH